MGKSGKVKTNALRKLDAEKIEYTVHEYDVSDGLLDGVSVARKTGQEPERVFKTLVTQGTSKEHYVCVIPVAKELDLKKAANFFGEKKLEMIPMKTLLATTGYIHGGCSPIGMKKPFRTAIDRSAENHNKIIVSAGKVGVQAELLTEDLVKSVSAEFAELT